MAAQVVLVRDKHGKVGGYIEYADAHSFSVVADGHLIVIGQGTRTVAIHAPGQWNSVYLTDAAAEHPGEAVVPIIGS